MRLLERLARFFQRLGDAAARGFAHFDRRLGGLPSLLRATLDAYNAHDGGFVSVAMAYYFLFTTFPLVLALIAFGSLILATEQVQQAAVDFIAQALPGLESVIAENINLVLAQRRPVGALALLGLLWSASGLFGVLLTVMDRAWGCPGQRPVHLHRLLSLALVLVLGLAFLVSTFSQTLLATLRGLEVSVFGAAPGSPGLLAGALPSLGSLLITLAMYLVLYWKLPSTRVAFADAWPAALIAAVSWELAKRLFSWYLATFTRYNLVYGSLAAVIGLLTWFYLTAQIILLGAELSVQIARRRGRVPPCPTDGN